MKLQYQITVPVFGTIWLLDFHLSFTVQDSIKCNVTFHKLHVFIPPGCTYSVGPTGVIQSLKTIWGCENTLPNLHKSYTTEGLVQVITGYIYIYIYIWSITHTRKVPVETQTHWNLIRHRIITTHHTQVQTHHTAKKGLSPSPPYLWQIPCSSIFQPPSSHCTSIPTRKKSVHTSNCYYLVLFNLWKIV